MALFIVDYILGILQSTLLGYTVIYCLEERKGICAKLIGVIAICTILSSSILTGLFGDSAYIGLIISHISILMFLMTLYRKKIINSIVSFSISYTIIQVYMIIVSNLIFTSIKDLIPVQYINYAIILIIYIPQVILIFYCIKNIKFIKGIYNFIIYEKFEKSILVITFLLDFILTFNNLALGESSQFLRNIVEIIFIIFLGILVLYFDRIHKKSVRISALNESLETKNNELRKIKHDYGAQISYLYGLSLMERNDDLKKSLKNIINNNDSTADAVEVNISEQNNNSVLALALKPAIDKGIHVIIEDCDLSAIHIKEMELYRIISNIVNNAIKAMDGKGIIIAKAYECFDNIVIKIQNNGPKIPEDHIDNIFKSGFTTKDNNDSSHGYGLSIVKELVESYNGKIYVKSTDELTEFRINFKIK